MNAEQRLTEIRKQLAEVQAAPEWKTKGQFRYMELLDEEEEVLRELAEQQDKKEGAA